MRILRVQGTHAAERLVVFGHLGDAFRWHVFAGGDVFEERDNVIRAFGAAEGDQQQGIVRQRQRCWQGLRIGSGHGLIIPKYACDCNPRGQEHNLGL